MQKKLCRAKIPNNNFHSNFESFEILTIREYCGENGGTYFDEVRTTAQYLDNRNAYGDIFYRVFGMYKNKSPRIGKSLGDFNDVDDARNFIYDLTGIMPDIYSY